MPIFYPDAIPLSAVVIDPVTGSIGKVLKDFGLVMEDHTDLKTREVSRIPKEERMRGQTGVFYVRRALVKVTDPAKGSHHRKRDNQLWHFPIERVANPRTKIPESWKGEVTDPAKAKGRTRTKTKRAKAPTETSAPVLT